MATQITELTNAIGDKVKLSSPATNSPSTDERLIVLEKNIQELSSVINGYSNVMAKLIANSNQIYNQIDINYNDNKIHIRASKNIVNSNAVLYILPSESIENTVDNPVKLIIHHGSGKTELEIVKEDDKGNLVALETGDIVSNRLCMFRINTYDISKIILLNASIQGDINLRTLHCGEAFFSKPPRLSNGDVLLSAATEQNLIDELDNRYQKKIVFGTVAPNDYTGLLLAGQIYIQTEDNQNV